MKKPIITLENDEVIELPFKWRICSRCEGHCKSSAYLGAFTSDEMHDQGPEFYDDYMAGRYDRRCEHCEGSGKVAVLDRTRCKPEHLKLYDEERHADREWRREQENEARMLGEWR